MPHLPKNSKPKRPIFCVQEGFFHIEALRGRQNVTLDENCIFKYVHFVGYTY